MLTSLVEHNDAPSLACFVKNMVGMERAAAQSAFADFLNDRSLNAQQMRFVEMVIDQLTARGVMKDSALYEAPFSQLHAGGPDELFAGKEAVVDSLFATLGAVHSGLSRSRVGELKHLFTLHMQSEKHCITAFATHVWSHGAKTQFSLCTCRVAALNHSFHFARAQSRH